MMKILRPKPMTVVRWVALSGAIMVTAAGCATGPGTPAASVAGSPGTVATAAPSASQALDTGTTSGDVPDNAVFLTYQDAKLGYTIQYVEGWQVTPNPDGIAIRDKDSSEVIQIVAAQADVAAYVSGTDLAALRQHAGFNLIQQDTVTIAGVALVHLSYDIPSPPDPVTGKQVPSIVDRYYVPGPKGLAVISLATPKGVDNVDAFRQMIESFRWA